MNNNYDKFPEEIDNNYFINKNKTYLGVDYDDDNSKYYEHLFIFSGRLKMFLKYYPDDNTIRDIYITDVNKNHEIKLIKTIKEFADLKNCFNFAEDKFTLI